MAQKKSYKTTCPNCAKNNYYVTESNGVSYCFNCGHWQRNGEHTPEQKVRSQYIDEIRALYKQLTEYYHSCLDGDALRFLLRRGYSIETIQKKKIGWCAKGKSPHYKGIIPVEAGIAYNETAFLGDRIIFPYYRDADTVIDIRGRSINPDEPLKYKSPLHGAYYRGADWPYNHQLWKESKRIGLTEGEVKSDIPTQYGFPTMGLPGMLSWREGLIQRDDQEYVLIFDVQKHDMHDVRRAISRAASKLENVYVGSLPLFGKQKMDIDSLIIEYGSDVYADVWNNALPYQTWKKLQRY